MRKALAAAYPYACAYTLAFVAMAANAHPLLFPLT